MHYESVKGIWDKLQNIFEKTIENKVHKLSDNSNNDTKEAHLVNENLDEEGNAYSNEDENEEIYGEEDLEG